MNTELIRQIADILSPEHIYLKTSEIKTHTDFSPFSSNDLDLVSQSFERFEELRVQTIEDSANTDRKESFVYHFLYTFGLRVISKDKIDEVIADENKAQDFVLVEIISTFTAAYISNTKIDNSDQAIYQFAEFNVPFNIWPYWREYVQSTCNRIGLSPAIPIPFKYKKCKP